MCARMRPHKCVSYTRSRSSMEVLTFRAGNTAGGWGETSWGERREESPVQRQEILTSLQGWKTSRHSPHSNPLRVYSAWLLTLWLISLSLEGSPLFDVSAFKSLLGENSSKLGFRQIRVQHVPYSLISEQMGNKAGILSRSLSH